MIAGLVYWKRLPAVFAAIVPVSIIVVAVVPITTVNIAVASVAIILSSIANVTVNVAAVALNVAAKGADLVFGTAGGAVVVMTLLSTETVFQGSQHCLIVADVSNFTDYLTTAAVAPVVTVFGKGGRVSGGKKQDTGAECG